MKIIHTDNFGGDYPDEKEVTGLPRLPKRELEALVLIINVLQGPGADRFYKVVEDNYKLQPGFEP